jgi:hypothetical protein
VQDLWKKWVAKLRPLHEPQPYKVASESPRCQLRTGDLDPRFGADKPVARPPHGRAMLDSGMHRCRARDSSFPDLHPHGGSSGLGGAVGELMTSASVWKASTRMRRRHAHDSVVGKHDLVGSDDMPATLASLRAGSLTWGQHILKGWFGVRHTLYFDFVGCTLYMCIFSPTHHNT